MSSSSQIQTDKKSLFSFNFWTWYVVVFSVAYIVYQANILRLELLGEHELHFWPVFWPIAKIAITLTTSYALIQSFRIGRELYAALIEAERAVEQPVSEAENQEKP